MPVLNTPWIASNMPKSSPLLFAVLFFTAVMATAAPLRAGDDPAQRMTELSLKQDVAENDPRVVQTRKQLDKVAKLTQEEPAAIAITCARYVGHLRDAAQIQATPLELLAVLVDFGQAGKPMRDTLQEYVAARKAVPTQSHAEAMAALGKKK